MVLLDALENPKEVPKAVLNHCFWNEGTVFPYNYFKRHYFIWILPVCSIFKKTLKSGISKSKGTNVFFIGFIFFLIFTSMHASAENTEST